VSAAAGSNATEQHISQMSAETLARAIGGKIHNLNLEAWTREDISGAALLEFCAPSLLAEFLEHTAQISTRFARARIEVFLQVLIAQDPYISSDVKEEWKQQRLRSQAMQSAAAASSVASESALLKSSSAIMPTHLFSTPNAAAPPPNASVAGGSAAHHAPASEPSFFSEIKSRNSLSLEDTSLFSSEHTHSAARASASTPAYSAVSRGGHVSGHDGLNIQVTLNQPSAKPAVYPILENASSPEFYTWLRQCRKVTLMAMPVDRRPLNLCVSQDVKDEVARIIVNAARHDPKLFDAGAPYPENWPAITDKLLLKVLFGLNGPRSASEAKARIKKLVFHFNDSTTEQSVFTQKLRKHCNRVKSDLADFGYNARMWKGGEELTHFMIVEAFSEGFQNKDMIKGRDGREVPRCANLSVIREMIRERKQLDLETLCTQLIDHFEAIDVTVRANRGVKYETMPWVAQTKKRNFNAISSDGGAGSTRPPKPPRVDRPPAEHPRCGNCGSKGHACSERTCYLWGAPGGLGATGVWADGTKSLRLSDEEWKAFRKIRHDVFYAYPENKNKAKPKGS
jgi:hypothetical protein